VIAARGGGIGAIVVFALFVLAMLVLAAFVIRFAAQQNRRTAERDDRQGSSDVPAAPTLDDDADDSRDGKDEPDDGGPEAEDER